MRSLKRRAKLLTTKLNALQSELKTSKEIVEEANAEIQKLYNERIQQAPEPEKTPEQSKDLSSKVVPPLDDSAPDTVSAEKNAPPEIKKMFKKVASICHPDKIQDLPEGPNKTWLKNLYIRAHQALEDCDFFELLRIWQDLDLEPPDITEQQLIEIENKIKAVKKELHMLESTIAWHWYFAKDEATKEKILKKVFDLLDERNKNNPGT
tara:strand:- start:644 stop:1267 length:624 start_codon:yes stop_codon:yes gene_type:complete